MEDFRNIFSKNDKENPTDRLENDNENEITNLVKEAIKGSYEAFGQLYRLYVQQIFRYVYYQVGDRMTAEDITADVFVKALDHIKSCAGKESTFKAWLYRIAHNRVIDYFRGRRKYLSLEANIGNFKQEPGKGVEGREILDVVSELPNNQRQVIILKFVAGLSNPEVALVMSKSQGAIRITQMRALNSLKKKLSGK